MKILAGRLDYTALEQELCGLHLASDDSQIDSEFEQMKAQFTAKYPELDRDEHFEFTDWHSNIRMLWVYLYSDQFYSPKLLANIHDILNSTNFQWFAQFECYSPIFETNTNQTGSIGCFFVYKDSAVFDNCAEWNHVLSRIAG